MAHEEYLRRNRLHCRSIGIVANTRVALKRLRRMKRPPAWVVELLQGIEARAKGLPAELAAWRNTADDAPDQMKKR